MVRLHGPLQGNDWVTHISAARIFKETMEKLLEAVFSLPRLNIEDEGGGQLSSEHSSPRYYRCAPAREL